MKISRDQASHEFAVLAGEFEALAIDEPAHLLSGAHYWRLIGEFDRTQELLMTATKARVEGARRRTADLLAYRHGVSEAIEFLNYQADEQPEAFLDLAEVHRRAGHRPEALNMYQRAVDARVPQAVAKYSDYLIDYGDFGRAQHVLDQAGDRDPSVAVQRMRLALKFDDVFTAEAVLRKHFTAVTVNQYATYMLAAGKPAEAVRIYEEAARLIHPSFLVKAGQVEEQFGNRHKAGDLFRSAAEQWLPALPAFADFLTRIGREEEGDKLLAEAVKEGATQFMLTLGARFEDRSFATANYWFNEATLHRVDRAQQSFAEFKERQGLFEDALETMTDAVEWGEPGARLKLAGMLGREAHIDAADLQYSFAVNEPNGQHHLSEYADFLVETGTPERAVMLLEQAVRNGSLELQFDIAAIFENDGKYPAAQKAYQKAVHWGLPNSFERLGRFYSARGRHLDAAHQFAVAVETGNTSALFERASALTKAKDIYQADHALLMAVNRRVPNAIEARADFLLQHEGIEAADAFLEENAGEKTEAWARLTRLRVNHGLGDKARTAYEKVVQLDPKSSQVRELAQMLRENFGKSAGPELA